MKDGPPYVIDALSLHQMLSDPGFYVRVPVFFFLKEQAEAIVQRGAECDNCGNLRQRLAPAAHAFVNQVLAMDRTDTRLLEPLAAYIAGRLHFRPRPIVVYYKKDDGRQGRVEF